MGELIAIIAKWMTSNKDCISLIVDILGTIATVAAVIVAIVANCKSNKSLKYSLKMQEQAKNVDLFDRRVSILSDIQGSEETPELPLQLLFDENICISYRKLREFVELSNSIAYDISTYTNIMVMPDGEGGYTSPIAEIIDFERKLEEFGYPSDKVDEFNKLCDKYQITYSETNEAKDAKVYNYKDLSCELSLANESRQKQKDVLVSAMKDFIQKSISPV